jgi:hypothetical protein
MRIVIDFEHDKKTNIRVCVMNSTCQQIYVFKRSELLLSNKG